MILESWRVCVPVRISIERTPLVLIRIRVTVVRVNESIKVVLLRTRARVTSNTNPPPLTSLSGSGAVQRRERSVVVVAVVRVPGRNFFSICDFLYFLWSFRVNRNPAFYMYDIPFANGTLTILVQRSIIPESCVFFYLRPGTHVLHRNCDSSYPITNWPINTCFRLSCGLVRVKNNFDNPAIKYCKFDPVHMCVTLTRGAARLNDARVYRT